jgi:RNA polymerase sigma-70 factor (ECF subfamily)
MERADAELVKEVLEGNIASFGVLVRKYQGVVYGLAYHMVKNFADAEDLAQEAFLRAYLELPQLREPSKFAGWLRRITCNICNMWLRSQRIPYMSLDAATENGDADLASSWHESDPAVEVERKELCDAVTKAINSLSEKNRLAVTLFYMDGLSYRQISKFLEVPVTTIESRLHKARKQLKAEMMQMVEQDFNRKKLGPEFATKIVEGALEIIPYPGHEPGYGLIRRGGARKDDIYIPPSVIRKFDLKTGDVIKGEARPPKKDKGEHYHAMVYIHTVNDKEVSLLSWKVRPVFAQDVFHFLWSIAEGTYYSRFYPAERSAWRKRLGTEIAQQIVEFVKTSHLSQSSLGTVFHFSDVDSIDGVLASIAAPELMKAGMLRAGAHQGWTESIFRHLEASKAELQTILLALKEAGYEEYWHQEIKPVVEQRCRELERELSRYNIQDILDSIKGLLGSGYNITHGGIYMTYFSAPLGYHLPDDSSVQSFIADRPIDIELLVSILIHELLHKFRSSPELREYYDGLYASPFFARSRELLNESWGEGHDEDFVAAAEKYISVKLGITSPERAFDHLCRNPDGSQGLGVIVYHLMNETALEGKTYEGLLLDLFSSGKIQADKLEEQYISVLETHIGRDKTLARLRDNRIAHSRYRMRRKIEACRRNGQIDDSDSIIQAWVAALKGLGYQPSSSVATETKIGATTFSLATFSKAVHVELEKTGNPKATIDIISFQDTASAQSFWNGTLGQENTANQSNFVCVFQSFIDREHVVKGCWLQEHCLINVFVIVPYTELADATDIVREIIEVCQLWSE